MFHHTGICLKKKSIFAAYVLNFQDFVSCRKFCNCLFWSIAPFKDAPCFIQRLLKMNRKGPSENYIFHFKIRVSLSKRRSACSFICLCHYSTMSHTIVFKALSLATISTAIFFESFTSFPDSKISQNEQRRRKLRHLLKSWAYVPLCSLLLLSSVSDDHNKEAFFAQKKVSRRLSGV